MGLRGDTHKVLEAIPKYLAVTFLDYGWVGLGLGLGPVNFQKDWPVFCELFSCIIDGKLCFGFYFT